MLTKNQLFQFLYRELEFEGVEDSEEIADRIAEKADEEGLFEIDEDEL